VARCHELLVTSNEAYCSAVRRALEIVQLRRSVSFN
jgi:hypothetical protein